MFTHAGNPRIVLQHEAFGLASPHTVYSNPGGTVRIYNRRAEQLAAATQYMTDALPRVVADRGSGEVGVATATGCLDEALDGAWLAVESVPEKLEIKIPLWRQIDQAAPPDASFATNSSLYPSPLMAENVGTNAVCATHTFRCHRRPTRLT